MARTRVYLDNCTYNRPFDDQGQIRIALETEAKKYIQQLIVEKKIDLVYSFITRFENSKSKRLLSRNTINDFLENAVFYIDHTGAASIGKRAVQIMKSNIKTKDAYHLSCAIEGVCDYFITTDKPLLKRRLNEIVICDPVQFLNYYEENQYD